MIRTLWRWWTRIHPKAKPEPRPADILARHIPEYGDAVRREKAEIKKGRTQGIHRARRDKTASLHSALGLGRRAYVEGR